jgi:CHAD domain-containing protein
MDAMPFHFKRKESVRKAVRRMCGERLDDALGMIDRAAGFDAVHNVRREIKKLRAVLRLIRADIGNDIYHERTHALREAAQRLTALRDAEVKLGAFDSLAKHFNGRRARSLPKIKAALQENCRTEENRLFNGGTVASIKEILCHEKEQFDDLKIKSNGWETVAPGLKKNYRRGREAFETAEREPSSENLHEWRKRVKDLAHQLRLLCRARPRKLHACTDDLDKLGALLGSDHDLFLLKEFVAGKFNHAPGIKPLQKLISSRQEELRSAALKLGAKLYPKKPKRFCDKIGGCWKSWKGEE